MNWHDALAINFWHDERDLLVKTVAPGGLVTKTFYDGAGRLLRQINYPGFHDNTNGSTQYYSSATFEYNALGEAKFERQQSGVTHAYTFDAAGRIVKDQAGVPSSHDSAVTALAYQFDPLGRVILASSLNATGDVVNQVKRSYNGFGQIATEHQAHSGLVGSNTHVVTYDYSPASDGSRLASINLSERAVGRIRP